MGFHRSGCGAWFLAERDTRTKRCSSRSCRSPRREPPAAARGAEVDLYRERELTFSFDGKKAKGLEGDTIASALFAAGRRTFSRSFSEPPPARVDACCAWQCPNCLVQVDGAPGVRAGTEPLREGMHVEHMNASPSLEFDAMRATDLFGGPFTLPGFLDDKTFICPRRLWPLYEKVLRHAAGLGKLRKDQGQREMAYRVQAPPRGRAGRGGRRSRPTRPPSPPPTSARTWCWPTRARGAGRAPARRGRSRACAGAGRPAGAPSRCGGAVRGPRAGGFRRPRSGLAGRHAPPGPRPADRRRDRVDRAAAAVPRQRPAGRDALRRRRLPRRSRWAEPG